MDTNIQLLADVMCDYFCHSKEPLALAYRERLAKMPKQHQGKMLTDQASQQVINELTSLEDWLTGPIVEDMLNISTRTLQTMRTNHTIPFARIGKKIYYKRSDIEAFLEARYAEQNQQKGGQHGKH